LKNRNRTLQTLPGIRRPRLPPPVHTDPLPFAGFYPNPFLSCWKLLQFYIV
jgi:hypothetical protein